MNYNNNLEYNEDISVQRYPKVPYFWSICFSVTSEDGRIVDCLISREVVEDYFHNDLKDFDFRSIARVEELMEEEILPVLYKAIRMDRVRQENKGESLRYQVELTEDDFEGKDFRK